MQTEQPLDISIVSVKSKSKKSKRGKNRGLLSSEFKARKPKKVKEVTVIAQNLEKMSSNISLITNKLDDFKRNPSSDESKFIIGHVGNIMNQLNGCIGNFESICRDIKQINETRTRSYDEWMDDLKNSENGRRFLKKLQKSFVRVLNEEKSKVQRECRSKLERDKSKLAKLYKRKTLEKKSEDFPHPVIKEISEIFQNTCQKIQTLEKQDELFLKSLELDYGCQNTENRRLEKQPPPSINAATKLNPQSNFKPVDLNKCRKLYSETSTEATYSSKSFESDRSDENN